MMGRFNCNNRSDVFCRNVVAKAMTVLSGNPHALRDSDCKDRLVRTALARTIPVPNAKGLWLRFKDSDPRMGDWIVMVRWWVGGGWVREMIGCSRVKLRSCSYLTYIHDCFLIATLTCFFLRYHSPPGLEHVMWFPWWFVLVFVHPP